VCSSYGGLKVRIRTAIEMITADMLQTVWNELDYRVDICLFVCFHGRPRQATDALQPAGLLYLPLWMFQLWPPDAPRLPTRSAL
jgi:hypothetical protein